MNNHIFFVPILALIIGIFYALLCFSGAWHAGSWQAKTLRHPVLRRPPTPPDLVDDVIPRPGQCQRRHSHPASWFRPTVNVKLGASNQS